MQRYGDEGPAVLWNDLESLLQESIKRRTPTQEDARRTQTPLANAIEPTKCTAAKTLQHTGLSQLVEGCGIAAIDGYLAVRDYADSKGLDLVEIHHKGIDLQDLISTLVIHTQRMAEAEARRR
jgi:hypothetical protein